MAQIPYRANLSAATFPMSVAKAGRSVIIPGPDQNYDRRLDPRGEQGDAGIPQAIYMENVLPSVNGYSSVGYKETTSVGDAIIGRIDVIATNGISTVGRRITILFLQNTAEYKYFYPENGYLASPLNFTAGAVPGTITINPDHPITTAFVNGVCYIFFQTSRRLATFDTTAGLVDITAAVTGLTVSGIIAICGSYNYLAAITVDTVFWSSTTLATDFTASLISGAGSEVPNNVKGSLVLIAEHANGFYIYTTGNVISAFYTGNSKYPWKFKEVNNSSEIDFLEGNDTDFVTVGVNLAVQYAFTGTKQICEINPNDATIVAPEVSELLSREIVIDEFNYTTNILSVSQTYYTELRAKLNFLLNRYLIISYPNKLQNNAQVYDYAIVYDTVLRRYGRLKIAHTHIAIYGDKILFIHGDTGACSYLYFSMYSQTGDTDKHNGVLILGKFQYVRSEVIQLEEVELESQQDTSVATTDIDNLSCVLLPSFDGKTFSTPVTLTASYNSGAVKKFKTHKTMKNFALAIKGAFDLNTVDIKIVPAGNR